jgi:hypothetical protein
MVQREDRQGRHAWKRTDQRPDAMIRPASRGSRRRAEDAAGVGRVTGLDSFDLFGS